MTNGKQKGNRAERALVKKFAKWWGSEFYRTPGSGSFATRGYTGDVDMHGDIITPDKTFPFCVESKNCEGWHIEQLITSPKCDIWKWWQQTVSETPQNKIPLLVFTRNRQPDFFMMRENDIDRCDAQIQARLFVNYGNELLAIGLLSDLMEASSPGEWEICRTA